MENSFCFCCFAYHMVRRRTLKTKEEVRENRIEKIKDVKDFTLYIALYCNKEELSVLIDTLKELIEILETGRF